MKITVLHSANTRETGLADAEEVKAALAKGIYYNAGTLDVGPSTDHNMMEQVWMLTQNDTHPNMIVDADGAVMGEDIRKMDEEDIHEILRQGGKVLPAVWNGEFAQRSSQVGDVFILEGAAYMVVGAGFEFLEYVPPKGYTLAKNEFDNRGQINEEFSNLVFTE